MKKVVSIIVVMIATFVLSENSFAQLIPVPGTREHPVNSAKNADISFGWGIPGISALYVNAGRQGSYAPVDVLQITNNGNFCFRGMEEYQNTFLHLLRGDVTYAKWSTEDYNCNFIAKNKIKLKTNSNHEIATFHTNSISFYETMNVEKNNIVVRCGLDNANASGWIGTTSETGCFLGAGAHGTIYMDTNYGVYIGGVSATEVAGYRAELKNKYKLFVKYGVLSEDFGIAPKSTWSDFVFSKNYNLLKISEVAAFIQKNNHLPNVPSAQQVAEEGYSQHDMNRILLQKIEELTLYTIQQQKEIDALKAQIQESKK